MDIDLVIQSSVVRNLVFFFDKIKLVLDCRIVLVLVFPNLEKHLNHVLHSFVDIGFVQDVPELIVDCHSNFGLKLLKMLTDFLHESYSNFDTVVAWLVQQQQQNLSC